MTALAADVLIVLGLGLMTVGVAGLVRMPTVLLGVHAASNVMVGVLMLACAAIVAGDGAIAARAALIAAGVLLTLPVSTHAIARAAGRDERDRQRGVS